MISKTPPRRRLRSTILVVDVRLVLASGSPRRSELLAAAGFEFDVAPADIDESTREGEAPVEYVQRLAREKCAAVPGDVVVAADTTVDVDGVVFAKPVDDDDARQMLRALSGRSHLVHTGVAIRRRRTVRSFVVTSEVHFVELADYEIDAYLATGEPLDKAGAYALQGGAARFVSKVVGSVSGVIGLPMAETAPVLDRALARVARHDLILECDPDHEDAMAEHVTLTLCGVVHHPGACRWPHISMRSQEGTRVELGVIVLAPGGEVADVRRRLTGAFSVPSQHWRLVDHSPGFLDQAESDDWWKELAD